MSHRLFRLFASLILALVLIRIPVGPQPVRAAGPWYVAPTGDDNNNCLGPSTPCATINGAIGKASSRDIVYVAEGAYTGTGNEVVLIDRDITLSGGWDTSFILQTGMSTIDGEAARRGVDVNADVIALLEHFIVQGGPNDPFFGNNGGIGDAGTLALNNSVVTNNESTGIINSGTMTLDNTAVTENFTTSGGIGGGVVNSGWRVLTM